jgi:glycosyltransferase involved in cell wall biosynthesis/SAM-dependent methyltransferase
VTGRAPALTIVVPGDLDTRTGGYGYDRRLIAGLRVSGWIVDVVRLDDSFPFPTAAARAEASRALAALPDGATVLVDGLALGALPDEVAREAARLDICGLVHHPLAAETGLDAAAVAALDDSERRALAFARAIVVTSRATADALAHYGVGADRITVIEPGTDRAPGGSPPPIGDPPSAIRNLLCVATLTPRKGHEILFRALASLRDRGWRLVCAGSVDRDPALVARLRAQLAADGIADRVALVGDLDAAAIAAQYDRAELFVLPTLYEGYGMAVAEALAHGLPVVSSATGGISEMVRDDAGIIVPPGDVGAFTAALARVLDDSELRARLAAGARRLRDRLPTWDDAAASMARILSRGPQTPTPTPVPTPAAGFSADWLALREPADAAARSDRLARAIVASWTPGEELRVLDLGAGTGANLRYLSARLPPRQRWLLVDHDPALLARAAQPDHESVLVETCRRDFAALATDAAVDLFGGRALVTASALLDLVSADWIVALAARCRAAGAAVLFALTYDGRIECAPSDRDDDEVRDLVNTHQRTDKGFGLALGPDAASCAARAFADAGYRIERERSDWVLTPASSELQRQLIDGWASAAAEVAPARAAAIDAWRRRRLAHLAAGRSELVVGHEDLAGWLG